MDAGTTTICLELKVAGDALKGRAVADSGAERAFSGWLGLVAALDELLAGAEPKEPRANGDSSESQPSSGS
jgi:hypothetical protein